MADDLVPATAAQTPQAWGFGPLFNAIKDAVIVTDASSGRILLWNCGAEAMLQYTAEEALDLPLEALVPPAMREAHRQGLASFAAGGAGALVDSQEPTEVPAVRKDGVELLIELSLSRIDNPLDPSGAYAMGVMRDVTGHREAEQMARGVLDASTQGMFALDRFGRCMLANPAAAELLRCDPQDLLGQDMHAFTHHSRPDGSPLPIAECQIFQTFSAGIANRTDTEVLWRADGTSFAADYRSDPMWRGGILLGAVVTFSDVSDRKRAEANLQTEKLRLQQRAETDVLTGIGNRRYADQVLADLQPGDSVVLIDIDRFKTINDTYGHNAGDEVLVSLAAHLSSQLRAGDHVARLGGEEFLVVLADGGTGAVATIERLARTWTPPISETTFTAGIAQHSARSSSAESLRRADEAMYQGKHAGRGQVVTARADSCEPDG